MKGGSEEAILPSENTFSLHAVSHKRNFYNVKHDFKPLVCGKTFKHLSVLPSYRCQYALPFQAEAALPSPHFTVETEEAHCPASLMVPKPSTRYCQVCKERFQDYLKHTSHPLHLEKVREAHSGLDINLIKELLNKSESQKKATLVRARPVEDADTVSDETSIKCEEQDNIEENSLFGSKKRIVVNSEGEMEALSLSGSTKSIDEEMFGFTRKSQRKGTVSKTILV